MSNSPASQPISALRESALQVLAASMGYAFREPAYLNLAITHKSYAAGTGQHNERLEFLGDSVLDLVLSDHLMHVWPEADEGDLSKVRATLVNEGALCGIALELQLDAHLRLGKGERQAGGATKPRLLASAYEALVGAVFLDGGYEAAKVMVVRTFGARLELANLKNSLQLDYKTRLQELAQSERLPSLVYEVIDESGPEHQKIFTVALKQADAILAVGQGKTKKQAEQEAARLALASRIERTSIESTSNESTGNDSISNEITSNETAMKDAK